jgi:predicted O-methyltransferase YrrM
MRIDEANLNSRQRALDTIGKMEVLDASRRSHLLMMPNVDQALVALRIRRHRLSKYVSVFSHTTPRERLALFQIARFLPSMARAVEIGSHLGSSALFLCAGLKQRNGHLYCVDTWMNDTMPDGMKDTRHEFMKNTKEFFSMITVIRKRSEDVQAEDFGCSLDFAFLDGDHSESAVRRDFKLVSSCTKIGGIVAFHDLSADHPGVGVVLGEALASGNWQLAGLVDCLGWIRRVS